ncbi:MAG: transcriptional repressor [Actinomycetota bacterium]|nr:transcriptional repressor [Actinomycetota bacterium]
MGELAARLRDRGWRMTSQRRVVAEVFVGDHVHLTAEEVFEASKIVLPEISMATVYNSLNEIVNMGELLEISVGPGPRRYDPNITETHQHLVCVHCGTLRDVTPIGQEQLVLTQSERRGFRLFGVEILFRGLCSNCAAILEN